MFSLGQWRPKHLLLSWIAYWGALAFVALGPAIGAIRRAMDAPPDAASASVDYGTGGLRIVISEFGQPLWTLSTTLTALALWIALPPLVLWVVWLALTSRRKRAAVHGPAHVSPNELPQPGAEFRDADRSPSPARVPSPIP